MNSAARTGMAFHGVPTLIVRTILALLLLAGIGWWWTGPSSDELVVYPARCTNGVQILPLHLALRGKSFDEGFKKYQADRANCQIHTLNRTVYKLNKARGEVYYLGLFATERLVDCSIFSRTDWTCSYPDGSGKVVIIDGLKAIHRDDVKDPRNPDDLTLRNVLQFFSLRRWQWWTVVLLRWIGAGPGAWLIPEQHEYTN